MIEPGTKYVIVGVHRDSAWGIDSKVLYGAIIEAVTLYRWQKDKYSPTGYWYGKIKFLEAVHGENINLVKNAVISIFAVYLRRVKEEAKP